MEISQFIVPLVIIVLVAIAIKSSDKKQKHYMELALEAQEKAIKLLEETNKILTEIKDSLRK